MERKDDTDLMAEYLPAIALMPQYRLWTAPKSTYPKTPIFGFMEICSKPVKNMERQAAGCLKSQLLGRQMENSVDLYLFQKISKV